MYAHSYLPGSVAKQVVLATAYDVSSHCRKALASHPEADDIGIGIVIVVSPFSMQHELMQAVDS